MHNGALPERDVNADISSQVQPRAGARLTHDAELRLSDGSLATLLESLVAASCLSLVRGEDLGSTD